MIDWKSSKDDRLRAASIEKLRDLSDFCQNWPELRALLTAECDGTAVENQSKQAIVNWLVLLADRVCATEDF